MRRVETGSMGHRQVQKQNQDILCQKRVIFYLGIILQSPCRPEQQQTINRKYYKRKRSKRNGGLLQLDLQADRQLFELPLLRLLMLRVQLSHLPLTPRLFPARRHSHPRTSGLYFFSLLRKCRAFSIKNGRVIPFAEVSTGKSRTSSKCFIYFHGNAEDISLVGYFLEPLVE